MKIPTSAQETSLRKLFCGNHAERERVIALQSPKMQQHIRHLIKAKQNSDKLFPILFLDLSHASGEMRKNPEDQFWRRTTIRALAATLDGIVYCLKETTLSTGKMSEYQFTDYELAFLSEESIKPESGKKIRLPGFRENLKQSFKLFAKVYNTSCPTDFGHAGFESLCETYELRHRLMHPKSYFNFCVSDEEKRSAGEAVTWLDGEVRKLLDACSSSFRNR